MAGKPQAEIEAAVKNELDGTAYAVSSLRSLTGGNANFIYHGKLQTPLPDGTTDVAVKHGEGYAAKHPDFALTMTRCVSWSTIRSIVEDLRTDLACLWSYSKLRRRACVFSPNSHARLPQPGRLELPDRFISTQKLAPRSRSTCPTLFA